MSGSILVVNQTVLASLKPKLGLCSVSKAKLTAQGIALKMKAIMTAHEHQLASLSAFASLALSCEHFLLYHTNSDDSPSHLSSEPSTGVHISQKVLQPLHSHLDYLVHLASTLQRKYGKDYNETGSELRVEHGVAGEMYNMDMEGYNMDMDLDQVQVHNEVEDVDLDVDVELIHEFQRLRDG